MSIILVTGSRITRRSEFGEKKLRCAVGGGVHHHGRGAWRLRGGRRGRAVLAASSTGTTTAEVSAGHLSIVPFDISHHVPQRQPPIVTLGKMGTHAVPETTSLFALLWRTRMIRLAHAASHVPSDTAGEHGTSTAVLVRPRDRAPTSESGVREHTLNFRCSSRTTRTRRNNKNAKMTTKAVMGGSQRLHYTPGGGVVFR